MKEMNREMELNTNELEQVNGGDTFCIGWGLVDSDAGAAACFSEGSGTSKCFNEGKEANSDSGFGAAACFAMFGIGFGGNWD